MTVTRRTEGDIEYLESEGESLAVAIDYSGQIDEINNSILSLKDETSGVRDALVLLLDEAKTANSHFASMVHQLTRIANCTCTPCSNVDMCAVVEKVLREDGVID